MRIENPRYTERFGSVRINAIKPNEKPPHPNLMAPLKKIDFKKFAGIMKEHIDSYSALEK